MKLEDKDAHGLGFNIGAMFKPTDKFGLGLAYRSNVDVSANKGDVTWTNVPTGIASNVPFNTDKWNTTYHYRLSLLSECRTKFYQN